MEEVKITDNVPGGLTFVLDWGNNRQEVVLGYTELGEWLESVTDLGDSS